MDKAIYWGSMLPKNITCLSQQVAFQPEQLGQTFFGHSIVSSNFPFSFLWFELGIWSLSTQLQTQRSKVIVKRLSGGYQSRAIKTIPKIKENPRMKTGHKIQMSQNLKTTQKLTIAQKIKMTPKMETTSKSRMTPKRKTPPKRKTTPKLENALENED